MDYKTARGWLRDEEREFIVKASSQVHPDGVIVNIGVEYGASIVCMRAGNETCTILAVDLDLQKLSLDAKKYTFPVLIQGDSSDSSVLTMVGEAVRELTDYNGAGLVFIDGDHSFEGVLNDANNYAGLVAVGGLLIFHDCYDYDDPSSLTPNPVCAGVDKAVQTWRDEQIYGEWIGLGIVGTMRVFERVG